MSTAMMTAAFKRSRSKGTARLVLLALADEANDEGLCTAYRRSQAWLSMKANCSIDSVRRAVETLSELGEVEVLRHGEGRKSSDYRITIPDQPPQTEGTQSAGADPAGSVDSPRAVAGAALAPVLGPSSRCSPVSPATTPSAAAPLDDPVKRAAHALTVRAFEQEQKPVVRGDGTAAFPAVMAIFERLLRSGMVVQHLLDAIEGGYVTVWTIAGIQTAVAQARGRPARRSAHAAAVRESAAALGVDPAELEADSDRLVEAMFASGAGGVSGLGSTVIDVDSRGADS